MGVLRQSLHPEFYVFSKKSVRFFGMITGDVRLKAALKQLGKGAMII